MVVEVVHLITYDHRLGCKRRLKTRFNSNFDLEIFIVETALFDSFSDKASLFGTQTVIKGLSIFLFLSVCTFIANIELIKIRILEFQNCGSSSKFCTNSTHNVHA